MKENIFQYQILDPLKVPFKRKRSLRTFTDIQQVK